MQIEELVSFKMDGTIIKELLNESKLVDTCRLSVKDKLYDPENSRGFTVCVVSSKSKRLWMTLISHRLSSVSTFSANLRTHVSWVKFFLLNYMGPDVGLSSWSQSSTVLSTPSNLRRKDSECLPL